LYSAEEDTDSVSIRVYVTAIQPILLSITDFQVLLNEEVMCDELPGSLMWEYTINRLFSTEDDFSIEGYVRGYYSLNETFYNAQCMVCLEFAPIPLIYPSSVPPVVSISFIGISIFGIILFVYRKYRKRSG
jgi:hypothetical protein